MGIFLICPECDHAFRVKKSHQYKSKCCSKKCLSSYYKKKFKGKNNPNYKNKGIKKCIRCGSEYKSYNKNRKYCCYECSFVRRDFIKQPKQTKKEIQKKLFIKKLIKILKLISKKKLIEKFKCICCGGIFLQSSKRKRIKKYCGNICRTSNLTGKLNPNYKDGRKNLKLRIRETGKHLQREILKRDNFTCLRCGQVGGSLNVDHIFPFSKLFQNFIKENKHLNDDELFLKAKRSAVFNNPLNLQTLCRSCNIKKMARIYTQPNLI